VNAEQMKRRAALIANKMASGQSMYLRALSDHRDDIAVILRAVAGGEVLTAGCDWFVGMNQPDALVIPGGEDG
jgi:hypothetical protein